MFANLKKRVVLGMSGGIDSSVCAALLTEQGFEVIGVTIKTYNYDEVGGTPEGDKSCCSLEGINEARIIAQQFNMPHYVLDFTKVFNDQIIENFRDEYMHGRTPNPCVICNRKIKWEELIQKSMQLGADYIAMGHYAKIRYDKNLERYIISRGKDLSKDQSYMLWNVTQESLSKTIFPLADFTKEEVRQIARNKKLKNAEKQESFEICFITDNDYERFLKFKDPTLESNLSNGEVELDGKIIGQHKGFPFYTVGQRKGLNTSIPNVYVTEIDYEKNKIKIGYEPELLKTEVYASQLNLIKYPNLFDGKNLTAKIRYKDIDEPAFIKQLDGSGSGDGNIVIKFENPKKAVTPGQSVVFYENDDLVGGAIIDSTK
ncbi:MAG: tRNA 2-thiouridine(34) synthase MnmA [Bacteroidetes bacterium]|nr:tRNA 2-thiouridine(34) synthase MnmA [Bacteroidota bacterium]